MTLFATIHAPSLPPERVQRLAARLAPLAVTIAGDTLTIERDPFGTQPLYYATIDDALVVTNALAALKQLVPRTLNREAIADYLAYGYNGNEATTTFAAIQRVPPAHRLIATRDGIRIERWWSLPIASEPLRIKPRDAVERFRELLRDAVQRQAAQGRVVVSLSGGIDSVSVAAHLTSTGAHATAITSVWDPVIPDVERHFASLAARSLGLPHILHECAGYQPFDRFDDPAVRGEEPHSEPFRAAFIDFLGRAAQHGRIFMTGQGGDPLLYASHDHFWRLLQKVKLLTFASDALGFALKRRRLPPLLLRSRLLRTLGRKTPARVLPPWFDTGFAREMHLAERFATPPPRTDPRIHPWRDDAFRLLHSPAWSVTFESFHEGVTRQPLALATPWLDPAVVEFLFALPPMPFFADKELAREALRGRVPDEIRLRPKSPLQGDPLRTLGPAHLKRWVRQVEQVPELEQFVSRRILCMQSTQMEREIVSVAAAVALALWLLGERSR
ncbi:MAG TPA: asparagine synthase-related protein [Thermoanaerobaculia bacterium]|nr:asparagine synthase-related protein [Thermoanaerobaculia bacterium]